MLSGELVKMKICVKHWDTICP